MLARSPVVKERPQNKNLLRPKKGERPVGAGRKVGTPNKVTRDIKEALLKAADLSKHSKNNGLVGYMTYLANDKQDLYVSLLGRLIPLQFKGALEVEHAIKRPKPDADNTEWSDYYHKLRQVPTNAAPPQIIDSTCERMPEDEQ